jgi:hypothetical protein
MEVERADWMSPVDASILKLFAEHSLRLPPKSISVNIGYDRYYVSRRCRVLKGSGLLFKDEYDLYVLTQYGSDYLDGETSPDSLSEHPPDLYTGHLNDSGRNFVSADSVELRHRVNFADRDVNDYIGDTRDTVRKRLPLLC